MKARVMRLASVAVGVIGAAGALVWAGPPVDARDVTAGRLLTGTVDQQVSQLAAIAAWGCLLWLALGAMIAVAAQLPGLIGTAASRASARITPAIVRRAVEAAVGAAVVASSVGGAAAPALARSSAPAVAATATRGAAVTPAPVAPGPDLGDRPAPPPTVRFHVEFDRPVDDPTRPPKSRRPAASSTERSRRPEYEAPAKRRRTPSPGKHRTARLSPSQFDTPPVAQPSRPASAPLPVVAGLRVRPQDTDRPHAVVVVRGDSLWSIAEKHLGPSATIAEIDAAWRQWYAANRRTIGPDPDLIRPGQRLHPPPG